jgi:hypothetical protein
MKNGIKPDWPTNEVDTMKKEIIEVLDNDGKYGPSDFGIRSQWFMFLMGVLDSYAETNSSVAYYYDDIWKELEAPSNYMR